MSEHLPSHPLSSKQITRRRLLQWGLGSSLGMLLPLTDAQADLPKQKIPHLKGIADIGSLVKGFGFSRPGMVIEAKHPAVFSPGALAPNQLIVKKMLDAIIMRLSGTDQPNRAWGSFVGPGDRVGILIDAQGSELLRTRHAVISAVLEALKSAGVREHQTLLWTTYARDLPNMGYNLNTSGPGLKVAGADQMGYDSNHSLELPGGGLFGNKLQLSRIVSALCTHIINISTLEDHPVIGTRLCLAQQAISSVSNGPSLERQWGGEPGIGQIAVWPIMRQRFVLHIIDGLAGTFNGGLNVWHPQILLGATDPVALDSIGFSMIDAQRQSSGETAISGTNRTPRYINTAAINGVGINDTFRIKHQRINIK
jgi:hypothetical protein